MKQNDNNRVDTLKSINAPLSFFALSLLIVEGFLTIALIFSDLSPQNKFWGMLIGAALFLLVVISVWFLVWFKPKNIIFGQDGYLGEMDKQGSKNSPGEKPDVTPNMELGNPQ